MLDCGPGHPDIHREPPKVYTFIYIHRDVYAYEGASRARLKHVPAHALYFLKEVIDPADGGVAQPG